VEVGSGQWVASTHYKKTDNGKQLKGQTMTYDEFLRSKMVIAAESGFDVADHEINQNLKPHQRDAVRWAVKGGKRALFESFGLGKTVQELEIARLVTEKTGGRALIVLPLGVRQEFRRDAERILGMEPPAYVRSMAEIEAAKGRILMTNYERVRGENAD
jgi:SNF2 family DNA or RNA helicase